MRPHSRDEIFFNRLTENQIAHFMVNTTYFTKIQLKTSGFNAVSIMVCIQRYRSVQAAPSPPHNIEPYQMGTSPQLVTGLKSSNPPKDPLDVTSLISLSSN